MKILRTLLIISTVTLASQSAIGSVHKLHTITQKLQFGHQPTGVMGMKFGSKMREIKRLLLKEGAVLNAESTSSLLVADNVKWKTCNVEHLLVYVDKKYGMYMALVALHPNDISELSTLHDAAVQCVTKEFGEPISADDEKVAWLFLDESYPHHSQSGIVVDSENGRVTITYMDMKVMDTMKQFNHN